MFRTIVVGYEGPGRGGEAVTLGETLRDPRSGTLLLALAYSPAPLPVGGFIVPGEIEAIRDAAEETLAEIRRALPDPSHARLCAIPCESAPRVLTELAESESADLVVVGSSHRSALGRVLLGTTAERLLHGAPCAVAVAPRHYQGGEVHHIAVAYDGSAEARAALAAAEALALELDATVTVYCVVEPAQLADGMLGAGISKWPSHTATDHARHLLYAVADSAPEGLELETQLLRGVAAEQIAGRVNGVADLLFVGSRAYGPLQRALLGTVSGALVRDAGCPVIVLPRTAVATAPGAESCRHGERMTSSFRRAPRPPADANLTLRL